MSKGPPACNEDSLDIDSPAKAIILLSDHDRSEDAVVTNTTMFPACMAVCNQFGGKDTVAEIALLSVYHAMMAEETLFVELALPAQVGLLTIVIWDDPNQQIARKMCELDGVPKLIEGLTAIGQQGARTRFAAVYWLG